jgi:Ca2+-binding RTX toxin-like protein
MAIGATNSNIPQNNPWLETLVSTGKWANAGGGAGPVVITYSFRSGTTPGDFGFTTVSAWKSFERAALENALKSWSDVANIQFQRQADNSTNANLQQWIGDLNEYGALGWHGMPEAGFNTLDGAYNNMSDNWDAASLQKGGYNFITMIHELGHALGLRHPHADGPQDPKFPGVDNDQAMGDHKLNQGIYTVMSYVDGWRDRFPNHVNPDFGWTGTPMALDIAAIQAIYGANMSFKTGNDTYALPTANKAGTFWSCIWDAGGTDTISAANARSACTIDLREATLSGENAGGFISWVGGIIGGFTIAKGAVIENAIGGRGNDQINGNEVNNSLSGGDGNDIIQGFGGDDRIMGGAGNDSLSGGAGNDTLDGGTGNDTLDGGAGNDTYVLINLSDVIVEAEGGGVDTVRAEFNFTLGETSNLENLILGGRGHVNGTGNAASNAITGNAGNNILSGLGGDDRLSGGAGNDTLIGGAGSDAFVFDTRGARNNVDRINDFLSGSDKILLDDIIYSALGTAVDAAEFFLGAAATATGHRIIYNPSTGGLFYDADGSGRGASVQFALLTDRSILTHNDFMII